MAQRSQNPFKLDNLESRLLLHGGHGGAVPHFVHNNATGGAATHVELGDLGGGFGEGCGDGLGLFFPMSPNATVQADVTQLRNDSKTLRTDLKALSSTDRATLHTDKEAIETAIEALSTTLQPLKQTLRTDLKTWRATIQADRKQLRADTKAGLDTTADKTKLESDQALGYAAILADQANIAKVVDNDPGVIAARAKLASDLPTISKDLDTLKTDQATLNADVLSQLQSGT